MLVRTHESPREFRERAGPFLLPREAENNLFFGLLASIEAGAYSEFWLATLEAEGEVCGCALQTPPFPAVVSELSAAARGALLEELLTRRPHLEGVNGPVETCRALAEVWCERTGAALGEAKGQGVFSLERVIPPRHPAAGRLRTMRADDLPLVSEWIEAFRRDAGVGGLASPAVRARERLAEGSLFLWEHERAVSMAAFSGPTPNGVRVNSVFTPPELRGRGYASAAVAALSQRLLDEGRRFCFLFTDLTNPTSNKIYQAIGYRQVSESVVLPFRPTEEGA